MEAVAGVAVITTIGTPCVVNTSSQADRSLA